MSTSGHAPRDPASHAKDPALAAYLAAKLCEERDPRGTSGVPHTAQIVAAALPFLQVREPGAISVRVCDREYEGSARAVIEVSLADQPFVVDTLRLNLRRLGLRERLSLHRLLAIDREDDGSIAALGIEAGDAREAYLYVEVAPIASEARRAEIAAELERVFTDLRHVVADHGRMVKMIRKHTAEIEFGSQLIGASGQRASELMDFLTWVADENYVFFGYRYYPVRREGGEWVVDVDGDSGLGLMRDASRSRFVEPLRGRAVPELIRTRLEAERLVFFDKSRTASVIHREGRLDCINVKVLDERGRVAGFGSFIGLLTHKAISTRGSDIPILRRRREAMLDSIGAEPGSHNYKAAIEAFDSLPIEFLVSFELADVTALVQQVLHTTERSGVEIAVVPDPLNRSFFVSAILPRASYDEELGKDIHTLLIEKYRANYVEHRSSFVDDEVALIHFFCTSEQDVQLEVLSELGRDLQDRATCWEDRFEASLLERYREREAYRLAADYAPSFDKVYRTATRAHEAARDVSYLERLRSRLSQVELATFAAREPAGAERLKIYQRDRPYLTDLLPVLHNCGLRVVDATLAEVALDPDPVLWITTCRMASEAEPGGGCPPRAMETLRAVLRGVIEDGTLNRLVVGAQLAWPEVSLLRAYLAYAAQLGIGPQVRFASTVLQRHPEATRCLVALFRASLDPDGDGDREAAIAAAQDAVRNAREPISTADEDRIFSLLQDLIGATVRTNFFTAPAEGEHIVVLKLKPRELARAPSPRPYAEIFVYAPSFSGTHLRGGPVARGGIRWSDRIQDFRKEILDLQRTQMVKNGLIVPAGAKGGFVLRRHFDSSNEAEAEADRQYARFMAALLQVTDNYADGAVVPPPRVVCLDGDDPYLVVAADKGTAHLSDVANRVAADSGYWLGDAFASGGSRGFDHKQLGITARGAWICARRHFLELGTDIEQEPFSLAGIGDMSGDVFGNGLLLARTGRLRAAFNHVHIFLDPDPDPERAWAERKRMFDLPHSSWRDYDADAISAGGGVFQRAAKAIELSPEARAALAIAETQLSGEELVSAILKMPVDLLWNGGVGTYVKSSDETHLDVGDRANDGVRVDARDLRARVVAEGGNLGFTRLARVEFALAGGRINSDAVDNSGGVDLSDHEVNLKVLLAQRVASGSLSVGERDRLLADSAEEAACSVLANSAYQSRAISLDVLRGARDPGRMLIATEFLERHAGLHPQLESLADAESLRARINAVDQGYTRPELAILLGYTKMLVKRELIAADVPDHPSLHKVLRKYFPEGLRRDDEIALHPLRREITATRLTNLVIDQAGVTLIPELTSALGAGSADVVSAYYAMDDLLGGTELRAQLAAQPITETARLAAALRIEAAIRTACRTHLSLEPCALESGEDAQRRRAAMQELREAVESALSEAASRRVRRSAGELEGDGIDRDLAAAIARLPAVVGGLGALSLMDRSAVPLAELVRLHAAVGERTRITWLLECLDELEGEGWDRIATESLYLEMLQAQRDLCARLLSAAGPHEPLDILEQRAGAALERLNATARELAGEARLTLSPLTVLAQQIRRIP